METKYTLIMHKPYSDDYCRGCHMASYSSDFELHNGIDEKSLIDIVSSRMLTPLEYKEVGYTAYIMSTQNGELVTYEIDTGWGTTVHGEESEDLKRIVKLIRENVAKIIAESKLAKEKEEEKKKEFAVKAKEEAARMREINERKQFEQLKLKYENNQTTKE